MAVEKSLVSGSMTMLLLGLLKEKDMYGYEMIDTLRRKSRNVFELKAGTLYPLLHGMEDLCLVVFRHPVNAGKRVTYRLRTGICGKGQKILQHHEKGKTGACQKDGRMAGICFRRDKRAGFSRIAEGNYG